MTISKRRPFLGWRKTLVWRLIEFFRESVFKKDSVQTIPSEFFYKKLKKIFYKHLDRKKFKANKNHPNLSFLRNNYQKSREQYQSILDSQEGKILSSKLRYIDLSFSKSFSSSRIQNFHLSYAILKLYIQLYFQCTSPRKNRSIPFMFLFSKNYSDISQLNNWVTVKSNARSKEWKAIV